MQKERVVIGLEGTQQSGKSTMLDYFRHVPGVHVVDEAAAFLIEQAVVKRGEEGRGIVAEPWFQEAVTNLQDEREQEAFEILDAPNSEVEIVIVERTKFSSTVFTTYLQRGYDGTSEEAEKVHPILDEWVQSVRDGEYTIALCNPDDVNEGDIENIAWEGEDKVEEMAIRKAIHETYVEVLGEENLPYLMLEGNIADRASILADHISEVTEGRIRIDVEPVLNREVQLEDVVINRIEGVTRPVEMGT